MRIKTIRFSFHEVAVNCGALKWPFNQIGSFISSALMHFYHDFCPSAKGSFSELNANAFNGCFCKFIGFRVKLGRSITNLYTYFNNFHAFCALQYVLFVKINAEFDRGWTSRKMSKLWKIFAIAEYLNEILRKTKRENVEKRKEFERIHAIFFFQKCIQNFCLRKCDQSNWFNLIEMFVESPAQLEISNS